MILQGSVLTQMVLGGLTTYLPVSYSLYDKNYESWLAVDKSYCNKNQAYIFGHPVYIISVLIIMNLQGNAGIQMVLCGPTEYSLVANFL